MRPYKLKTKILLDSGDPTETKEAIRLLGFLDGQTTNPTLIAKNPKAKKRLEEGNKFTREEILSFYKSVVGEISSLIPDGSVSIEVYADLNTKSDEMYEQGKEMFAWIPNAHVKYPTTKEGLLAAKLSVEEGIRVNMTLCFSQEQAAAVYSATNKASYVHSLPGFANVFVSPFIGRLDDRGENGMDLIKNVAKMYSTDDDHVALLAASIRNIDHFMYSLYLEADIITAPFKILQEWVTRGMPLPSSDFMYKTPLRHIPYQNIDMTKPWDKFVISHELTKTGIERFSADWNALVGSV